jgi:ABC-type multidrug transport system permease subunit
LGGSFFPFQYFPGFLQAIGQLSPNRWAILAIQNVAYARPWADLVLPVVVLCAIGSLGCITALLLFHRRLATGGRL